MVGRIYLPPCGDRVKVSENLGATAVVPVTPMYTFLTLTRFWPFLTTYLLLLVDICRGFPFFQTPDGAPMDPRQIPVTLNSLFQWPLHVGSPMFVYILEHYDLIL